MLLSNTTIKIWAVLPVLVLSGMLDSKAQTADSAFERGKVELVGNYEDINGNKQGHWTKWWDSEKVAYEGYFLDGRPVGKFRRYYRSGELKADLDFEVWQPRAEAEFYYVNGALAAKGAYDNRQRTGEWQYFLKDSTLIYKEELEEGMKNGQLEVYYRDGSLLEKTEYVDDVKHGMWKMYFDDETLRHSIQMVEGEMEGPYEVYHPNGQLYIKGTYKNSLKEGKWLIYEQDGKLKQTIIYHEGIAENQDELDAKETEEINRLLENKGSIPDPAKFINNPEEYIRRSGE